MIKIKQTIFDFVKGNCLTSCIASVLELPLEKVPNFIEKGGAGKWNDYLAEWLEGLGLGRIHFLYKHYKEFENALVIVGGQSPRFKKGIFHAVVWQYSKMIHDPHPSNDGIIGDPVDFMLIYPLDPGKLLKGKKI